MVSHCDIQSNFHTGTHILTNGGIWREAEIALEEYYIGRPMFLSFPPYIIAFSWTINQQWSSLIITVVTERAEADMRVSHSFLPQRPRHTQKAHQWIVNSAASIFSISQVPKTGTGTVYNGSSGASLAEGQWIWQLFVQPQRGSHFRSREELFGWKFKEH